MITVIYGIQKNYLHANYIENIYEMKWISWVLSNTPIGCWENERTQPFHNIISKLLPIFMVVNYIASISRNIWYYYTQFNSLFVQLIKTFCSWFLGVAWGIFVISDVEPTFIKTVIFMDHTNVTNVLWKVHKLFLKKS